MIAAPVLILLLFNAGLFFFALSRSGAGASRTDTLFLSVVFLISGMPALIYQIVWQRALFLIYGVNSQSVAVVVSAFMIGLGLGSLLGGYLSSRWPHLAIRFFGLAELGVAAFGLASLRIFHWFASFTSGAGLAPIILYSLLLLFIPTLLMGATLPLLTEQLVKRCRSVGDSISRLYFVNTLGSAISCYLCATFLLRSLGQSGSVIIAALLNTLVGASAYIYATKDRSRSEELEHLPKTFTPAKPALSLGVAMFLALLTGWIALGYEITWFRVFAIASSDRAPAFALLLATYLCGIASGSFLSEYFTESWSAKKTVWLVGGLLLVSGAISPFLPPLVSHIAGSNAFFFPALSRLGQNAYLASAPAFFLVAMLLGSVLPLLCRLSIAADDFAGRRVSLVYASNILGSMLGSLGIGFVLMQHLRLHSIALLMSSVSIAIGFGVLLLSGTAIRRAPLWMFGLAVLCAAIPFASSSRYGLLYERLIFHHAPESKTSFAHTVENRSGVVNVLSNGALFGGGVYDGFFQIDPANDSNLLVRAIALSAMHRNPRRVLVIGLASGSWAQFLVNHPSTQSMDIVEINPGYLGLIPQYPVVRSLLTNPKVRVFVDDGRRWLIAHPDEKYDLIVVNTTYHWRDHSTTLLSQEFFQLARLHLNTNGIYFFNSTESDETMATALSVFPYGFRVINFLAVSDSPIHFDSTLWMSVLRDYRIDGKLLFDPLNPSTDRVFRAYSALASSVNEPPRFLGLESNDSLRGRLKNLRIITDDNMGLEWDSNVKLTAR